MFSSSPHSSKPHLSKPWLWLLVGAVVSLTSACGSHYVAGGGDSGVTADLGDVADGDCADGLEIDDHGFPVLDLVDPEEIGLVGKPQCVNLSQNLKQGGTLIATLCSQKNPAAQIIKDPNSFASGLCTSRCRRGKCVSLSKCVGLVASSPTVVNATCTRRGTCRNGKPKWRCSVTLTQGDYDCRCRCR